MDKYNYNVEFKFKPDNHKTSLNFDSWIGKDRQKIRVCLKCKEKIIIGELPKNSIAESELPVVPPATMVNGKLIYLH